MPQLKNLARHLLVLIATLAALLILYVACAWLLPFIPGNTGLPGSNGGVEVYVRSNGVHTDLLLPVRKGKFDLERLFPRSHFEDVNEQYDYLAMGWGDKGFYLDTPTWADLKMSTAFNAAFGLGGTAMHVSYEHRPRTGPRCRRLLLSPAQYRKLIGHVLSSFRMNGGGPIVIDHPGYSDQDCFYEANGAYSMFRTCNVWTGEGLRSAGIGMGCWTPTEGAVLQSLE